MATNELSAIMTDLQSGDIGNAELLAKDKTTGNVVKVDGNSVAKASVTGNIWDKVRTTTIVAGSTSNLFLTFSRAIPKGAVIRIVPTQDGVISGYCINHNDYKYPTISPAEEFTWIADQDYGTTQNFIIVLNSQMIKENGVVKGGDVSFTIVVKEGGIVQELSAHEIENKEYESSNEIDKKDIRKDLFFAQAASVEFESGGFGDAGVKVTNNRRIRAVKDVAVYPGFYAKSLVGFPFDIYCYDVNGVYLSNLYWKDSIDYSLLTPGTAKIRFAVKKDSAPNDDISSLVRDIQDNFVIKNNANKELSASNPTEYYYNKLNKEIANLKKSSAFKFAFFSDVHKGVENVRRCFHVAAGLGLDAILNGGDTVSSVIGEGLEWYDSLVDGSNVPVLTSVGNHDAWSAVWNWANDVDVYNAITSKVATEAAPIVQPSGAATNGYNFYYKDFSIVRIIVLFSMIDRQWTTAQSDFLSSALSDALTNNKHVIILNHAPFKKSKVKRVNGWNSWMDYSTDNYATFDDLCINNAAVALVKTFIDNGGKFVGWLSGHTHYDNTITHLDDERQINFNVASALWGSHNDGATKNDITSPLYDCFNVFGVDTTHGFVKVIRCGWDQDSAMQERKPFCWDYINHRIIKEV